MAALMGNALREGTVCRMTYLRDGQGVQLAAQQDRGAGLRIAKSEGQAVAPQVSQGLVGVERAEEASDAPRRVGLRTGKLGMAVQIVPELDGPVCSHCGIDSICSRGRIPPSLRPESRPAADAFEAPTVLLDPEERKDDVS
jgi:hypothetical protein